MSESTCHSMLDANVLKLLCLWRILKHFYWLYEKTIQRAQVHPGILRPNKTLPLWNSSNKSCPISGIDLFKKQTTSLSWKSSQTGYQTKSDLKIQCTLTCWLLQWYIQPSWDFMPQLWSKSQEGDMCWEQKPDETPQFEHQDNHTGIYSPLHKSGSDRMDVTV